MRYHVISGYPYGEYLLIAIDDWNRIWKYEPSSKSWSQMDGPRI